MKGQMQIAHCWKSQHFASPIGVWLKDDKDRAGAQQWINTSGKTDIGERRGERQRPTQASKPEATAPTKASRFDGAKVAKQIAELSKPNAEANDRLSRELGIPRTAADAMGVVLHQEGYGETAM